MLSCAMSMAPAGTLTFANGNNQYSADAGTQAWENGTLISYINSTADLFGVVAAAISRVVAAPRTATGEQFEPEFHIRKSSLKVFVTNCANTDCEVTAWPWVCRYDGCAVTTIYTSPAANETTTGVTSFVRANELTIGWNPFQARAITENMKLLKPRRIRLQGGQSFTFTLKDSKPMKLNWSRLTGGIVESPTTSAPVPSIAGRTRGFFFTVKASVIANPDSSINTDWAQAQVNAVATRSYDWVAPTMPYRYNDVEPNQTDLGDSYHFVAPQTGAIVTYAETGS